MNWKLFVLIILINVVVAIVLPDPFSLATNIVAQNFSITLAYIIAGCLILCIPLVIGFFIPFIRRSEGDIFWLGWFLTALILCFLNSESLIFLTPAAAVLIAYVIWPIGKFKTLRWKGKTALTMFMIIAIFISISAYDAPLTQGSPTNNWTQALVWCNQNTPANASILTLPSYSYWVIDIAHRTPVFSYSGLNSSKTSDLALAYCTNDTSTTIQIMNKYGATYIIFSTDEVAVLPQLTKLAFGQSYGNGQTVPDNMINSVYYRFVFGNVSSDDGLTKVYYASQNQQEVVVLKLEA